MAERREETPAPPRKPGRESMDEVATRIPEEVGHAARRLRRGAERFGLAPPPPDSEDEAGTAATSAPSERTRRGG
ncbi:hypothetical protein ACWFR1_07205 [Streptomyces sp. NPDC055103]